MYMCQEKKKGETHGRLFFLFTNVSVHVAYHVPINVKRLTKTATTVNKKFRVFCFSLRECSLVCLCSTAFYLCDVNDYKQWNF